MRLNDGRRKVFGLDSYQEAEKALELVDGGNMGALREYSEVHNMEPKSIEIYFPPRDHPLYCIHFEPGDEFSRQMVADGGLEKQLEGVTGFESARKLKDALE